MHGLAVTTVEGIGSVKNGLHPVQVIIYITLTRVLNVHRPKFGKFYYHHVMILTKRM